MYEDSILFIFQKSQYKPLSKEVLDKAWTTMTKSSDWKFHSESKTTGDKIETKVLNGRKIFKLTVRLILQTLITFPYYRLRIGTFWKTIKLEKKKITKLKQKTLLCEILLNNLLNCVGKKSLFCKSKSQFMPRFLSFWLKVWYWYGKLKLKTQFPSNSFGLFAETWTNF